MNPPKRPMSAVEFPAFQALIDFDTLRPALRGLGRPAFFLVGHQWESSIEELALYVDIDRRGHFLALGYEAPPESFWLPFFEVLSRMAPDLEVEQARTLSWVDLLEVMQGLAGESNADLDDRALWREVVRLVEPLVPLDLPVANLPLFLLSETMRDYQGRIRSHAELRQRPPGTLICRCFGLYSADVAELLAENPNLGLMDITNETKAGAGCASCLDDIENAIDDNRNLLGIAPTPLPENFRINGLLQPQLILQVDEALAEWPLEVMDLKGYELVVKATAPDAPGPSVVQKFFLEKWGVRFNVRFQA